MKFKHTSLEAILSEPVDLQEVFENIDFEDEQILDASKAQANLFLQASRLYIQTMRSRVAAESRVKLLTSKYSLRIRRRLADDANGARVTEGHVAAKLLKVSSLQTAQKKLEQWKTHEEFCKLLLEAFRMRRDVIKVVGNLIGAEVYIARENSGHSALQDMKRKLRKRYPRNED